MSERREDPTNKLMRLDAERRQALKEGKNMIEPVRITSDVRIQGVSPVNLVGIDVPFTDIFMMILKATFAGMLVSVLIAVPIALFILAFVI